jgi:drug/metabolite transporter (DMT)-like permease
VCVAQLTPHALPTMAWPMACASGAFISLYYTALMMGCRNGEFGVVYPMARSLPVLLPAGIDVILGGVPSPAGWIGILLVVIGCLLVPQRSLRTMAFHQYGTSTLAWTLIAGLATTGYSAIDKIAAVHLRAGGPASAARYCVAEFAAAALLLQTRMRMFKTAVPPPRAIDWRFVLIAAFPGAGATGPRVCLRAAGCRFDVDRLTR